MRSLRPMPRVALAGLTALAGLIVSSCASSRSAVTLAPPAPTADAARAVAPSGQAMRLFEDAVRAWQEQKKLRVFDWALLERKFTAVVQIDDSFAEAWYDIGLARERQRKSEEAKAAYRNALQRKPTLKQAAENLAVMLQNEGRPSEAVAIYQDILNKYPEDGPARARMAAVYREVGDLPRAMRLAREALMREPQNLTAYKVLMRCYLDQNQLSMAKLVALRAIHIDGGDPELYYTMGLVLAREGDAAGAVAQFRRALQHREDFSAARVQLAALAAKNRDWLNASEQLQRLLAYEPQNEAARVDLAVAYKGLGKLDEAQAQYEAVLKANPDNALAQYDLGVLLQLDRNAPDKALEHYRKFLALEGGNTPADHPVFDQVRTCELLVRQAAEAKVAEERAKREAEEKKKEHEEQQRIEKQQAEDQKKQLELQKQQQQQQELERKQKQVEEKKAQEQSRRAAEREKRQRAAARVVDDALQARNAAKGGQPEARPVTQSTGAQKAHTGSGTSRAKQSRLAEEEPADGL